MFFEMLYGFIILLFKGRPPYNAQSEAALISNILHTPLNIPSSPHVSDMAKDFIRKCVQVDEGRRLKVKDMFNHPLIQNNEVFISINQIEIKSSTF